MSALWSDGPGQADLMDNPAYREAVWQQIEYPEHLRQARAHDARVGVDLAPVTVRFGPRWRGRGAALRSVCIRSPGALSGAECETRSAGWLLPAVLLLLVAACYIGAFLVLADG